MSNVQRVNLQPAYLLHSRPYKNTSAIVDILTPEYGRISLVAKGIKQTKSPLKGLLRAFQPLLVSWSGRGELGTLTRAEAQGRAIDIDNKVIACGLYLNELMCKLFHQHDPHIELFSHYDQTLRKLEACNNIADKDIQTHLRLFEVGLLQELGFALILDRDVESNEAIDAACDYLYYVEQGPVAFHSNESGGEGVKLGGQTLLALANKSLSSLEHSDEIFRQARQLMRVMLDFYLGHKTLHSRQLLRKYHKIDSCKMDVNTTASQTS